MGLRLPYNARLVGGESTRSSPLRSRANDPGFEEELQVRGITRETADRLLEEGIEDANQLAMADPYRILRNTSFDKRQVLRWLDCAILMTKLPESYLTLERRGIAGAMDLVWYALDDERRAALAGVAADAKMDSGE